MTPLERCEREIADIEAYWRDGGECAGALIGWLDQHAEKLEIGRMSYTSEFEMDYAREARDLHEASVAKEKLSEDTEQQLTLFENEPKWTEHWEGMPEFRQENLMPWQTVNVHFRNRQDRMMFEDLIGQHITDKTPFVWFPEAVRMVAPKASSASSCALTYPVYIISKGRWESRQTARALDRIGVPYRICVEPQEYDAYAAVIDPAKILTLPFSDLGQGSIPARNWVWDHSISEGYERHWILDDNISGFQILQNNTKAWVSDGTIFAIVEAFADRYENLAICGLNYRFLAKSRQVIPPFVMNTRIYSCMLIQNSVTHRWRGRYNEDTDLSLRILKDGQCTCQFNAFLSAKTATMTMKGGNTDELYKADGRRLMAESLQQQHPDVVTITRKWNRWQHQVDYRPFRKNKLVLRAGVEISKGVNNYGMELYVDEER